MRGVIQVLPTFDKTGFRGNAVRDRNLPVTDSAGRSDGTSTQNCEMPEVLQANLYDFPKYYDLIFGSDWKAEFDFLRACFDEHALRRVRRVFEPACGTGRLLIKLSQAGYEVGGNDLNSKAIDYCNARLTRFGFPASAVVGDMSDLSLIHI